MLKTLNLECQLQSIYFKHQVQLQSKYHIQMSVTILKGILSHIHKPYLKDRHFYPDHNYILENLKNFFIWEKKGKN